MVHFKSRVFPLLDNLSVGLTRLTHTRLRSVSPFRRSRSRETNIRKRKIKMMLTSCAEFWERFRAPHSLSFTWCANINVFSADFFVSYDGFYRKSGADRCLHTYIHTYIHTYPYAYTKGWTGEWARSYKMQGNSQLCTPSSSLGKMLAVLYLPTSLITRRPSW